MDNAVPITDQVALAVEAIVSAAVEEIASGATHAVIGIGGCKIRYVFGDEDDAPTWLQDTVGDQRTAVSTILRIAENDDVSELHPDLWRGDFRPVVLVNLQPDKEVE